MTKYTKIIVEFEDIIKEQTYVNNNIDKKEEIAACLLQEIKYEKTSSIIDSNDATFTKCLKIEQLFKNLYDKNFIKIKIEKM